MLDEEIIEMLESVKWEHYSEPEGLGSCELSRPMDCRHNGAVCDCGADEANAKIDRIIEWVKDLTRVCT